MAFGSEAIMMRKRKPNVLYWMLIIPVIVLSAIAVYAVILIINSGEPLFSKTNLSNILSIAAWIIVSPVVLLRINFHSDELYGLPGEEKGSTNPDDEQDNLA